jgi:hypothetical protein
MGGTTDVLGLRGHHPSLDGKEAIMVEIRFEVETALSPQRVRAGATDFSERRPQIWSGIDPEHFRVHALGDGTAEVTEGGREFGGIWVESTTTGLTRTGWSLGCWTPTSSTPEAGGSCWSDRRLPVEAGWSGPRSASPAVSKDAWWSWSSWSPAGGSSVVTCSRPCRTSRTRRPQGPAGDPLHAIDGPAAPSRPIWLSSCGSGCPLGTVVDR